MPFGVTACGGLMGRPPAAAAAVHNMAFYTAGILPHESVSTLFEITAVEYVVHEKPEVS